MSGHSKWSTIKHKKAKVDAQRGVAFQKYSREIIVAAKMGGGDPAANFRLRTAIEKAKAGGLPNDNIKRAIEKGCGAGEAENYEELTYEGYGAGGVAVIVEAMTDNRNRTAGDYLMNQSMQVLMILLMKMMNTKLLLHLKTSKLQLNHWKNWVSNIQMQNLQNCHRILWKLQMKKQQK